jgi:hypothetical protein
MDPQHWLYLYSVDPVTSQWKHKRNSTLIVLRTRRIEGLQWLAYNGSATLTVGVVAQAENSAKGKGTLV